MRKMILTLAVVLLAAPTWAGVTITLTDLGNNEFAIGYDATTEAELVRALALDVTATDGNIVDINDYSVGDDIAGYGIFPGNFSLHITVNPTTGMVDSWADPDYTPVAPADDPGALGGLGTGGITIEMGSLYDTMAPAKSGVLCTVTVSEGTKQLCVEGNAIRGNIVMENAAEVVPAKVCIDTVPPDCFSTSFTTYTDWVAYKKPKCWCNKLVDPAATGDYQCDGDASGQPYLTTGWRVYTDDLNLLAANWKKKISGADPAYACADVSHKGYLTTGWRVYTDDLNILAANWKKKAGTPPTGLVGNCGLAVATGGKPARPE